MSFRHSACCSKCGRIYQFEMSAFFMAPAATFYGTIHVCPRGLIKCHPKLGHKIMRLPPITHALNAKHITEKSTWPKTIIDLRRAWYIYRIALIL